MSETYPLPAVILGDHGFMTLYGSRLSDSEIVSRMVEALEAGIPMLSGGDFRLGVLVVQAFAAHGAAPCWVKHLDAPLLIDARPLPFSRAMASLGAELVACLDGGALRDPIMGPFLRPYVGVQALDAAQIRALQLDAFEVQLHVEAIAKLRPSIVTVGGDITDFLLASGRSDLLHTVLDRISAAAAKAGAGVFVCTYVGFAWPDTFRTIATRPDVRGVMVPANVAGMGMLPSAEESRTQCRSLGKSVLAMHALGIGTLSPRPALQELLDWPEISAAIVGASSSAHIQELAAVRREILSGLVERSA